MSTLRAEESPFFLPYQHPTIVDMQYVSHVERAVASAMQFTCTLSFARDGIFSSRLRGIINPRYYKGYDIRKKFKHIDAWLSAYEKLPHYMATKSDYYTHCPWSSMQRVSLRQFGACPRHMC